jgi:hypothetical protein
MMSSASGLDYQARRKGSGFTAGSGGEFQISWNQAFMMQSARAIAMELEKSQGIHRPDKSPVTTPRALGYRVMASMLELTLGDRLEWSTEELEGGPLDPESAATHERLQSGEDTRWALQHGGRPVAQLDNFGWLEIEDRKMDLHTRYRELDGRLYPLVGEIFGSLLP